MSDPVVTADFVRNHPLMKKIRNHLRVTKVVCTRSVKGQRGDNYVGFSSGWDTIQDDAGGGGDLISTQEEKETQRATSQAGMTLAEARMAALVLSMQVDISAHDHAYAGGNISAEYRTDAIRAIKSNYAKLIVEDLSDPKNLVKVPNGE